MFSKNEKASPKNNSNTLEEKQSEYLLYSLPDNEPDTLVAAQLALAGKNAVLLFPDERDTSSSSQGARKYQACFLVKGQWLLENKELKMVSLGNLIVNQEGLLSAESITNYHKLINKALLRAGINQPTAALEKIPKAVHEQVLLSYLDNKSLAALAQSSSLLHKDTKTTLQKKELAKLLQHVIYGEQEEAEAMLKAHPALLLKKGTVTDYSGRKIQGTALQLALGAEDAEMCEMLAPYFARLADGQAEYVKQYREQFPENEAKQEKQEQKEESPDIGALKNLIQVIGASHTDAECEPALEAFREFLKPKGIIKSGNHFNAELLLTAYQLYDANYDHFGGWNSRKNNLCWRKVIGYIQRFLPACYAQAFCQSLYNHVDCGRKLRRSLEFRYDSGCFFFPLPVSQSGLGFDYAILRGRVREGPAAGRAAPFGALLPNLLCQAFNTYVKKKRARCELMQPGHHLKNTYLTK